MGQHRVHDAQQSLSCAHRPAAPTGSTRNPPGVGGTADHRPAASSELQCRRRIQPTRHLCRLCTPSGDAAAGGRQPSVLPCGAPRTLCATAPGDGAEHGATTLSDLPCTPPRLARPAPGLGPRQAGALCRLRSQLRAIRARLAGSCDQRVRARRAAQCLPGGGSAQRPLDAAPA